MIRYAAFCLIIETCILSGCKANKPISGTDVKSNKDLVLLAWNEDTVHVWQFAISKKMRFYYTITKDDSLNTREYYYGKVSKKPTVDTLFLNYYDNKMPAGAKPFLVREASNGAYLIQFFYGSSNGVFLRMQRVRLTSHDW